MYLLTFRVGVTTPRGMDEMGWRRCKYCCACSRRIDFIASSACVVRVACGGLCHALLVFP